MIEVREIASEETHDMRHRILRPTQPREMCEYPGDRLDGAFHVGAYEGEKLIGIASFSPEDDKEVGESGTFRLRGMAVDPLYRRQGVGKLIMEFSFEKLKSEKVRTLWCRAREVAFSFYQGLGFEFVTEMYDIPDIGPHKTMKIHLQSEF